MAVDFTLDPDEQVTNVFRRHWISIFPVIVSTGLLLGGVLVLTYFIGRYSSSITPYMPLNVLSMILLGVVILAVVILVLAYVVFQQNKIVLTTLRLEELNQLGLFSRTISRLGLTEIEDVTSRRRGLLQTLLQYGDVVVQTAGEQEHFNFHQIGHPDDVAQKILEARTQCENRANAPKN